ncbi:MAG: class I SAM-dependent methyltransferase [Acidobacteriota bacterium]
MKAKLEDSGIKEHWTSQAKRHGASHCASWSDANAIEIEKRVIAPRLREGTRVLDIGCSNGHATLAYARSIDIDITGMDYVPEMIEAARGHLREAAPTLRGRASFETGDIRALPFESASFDTVITTRVVINLQNPEAQEQGIRECLRVARPGGEVLLSEATLQGLEALNRLRAELGQKPLSMPAFNLYLDAEALAAKDWGPGVTVEALEFSSTYYLFTRVLKPLLEHLPGSLVKAADPLSEVNRLAGMLPSWGDYGVQKLFILRKTG